MQTDTISKNLQQDVIASFWMMMQELRTHAENMNDPILKMQVEGWYRQWNEITGDTKVPDWVPVKRTAQLLTESATGDEDMFQIDDNAFMQEPEPALGDARDSPFTNSGRK